MENENDDKSDWAPWLWWTEGSTNHLPRFVKLQCKVHITNSKTKQTTTHWCTLVYVQVSESCHTLHLRSQSGHMVMLASQTSFLQQDNKPPFITSSYCACVWYCASVVNLHERRAVKEGQAIKEDYDPDDGGWDEEERVPAKPQVVQGHLLPEIVPSNRTQERKRVEFRICSNTLKLGFLFLSILKTVGRLCIVM